MTAFLKASHFIKQTPHFIKVRIAARLCIWQHFQDNPSVVMRLELDEYKIQEDNKKA